MSRSAAARAQFVREVFAGPWLPFSVAEKQGRFLVVRGGAIGDFILTLPVFAALRAMFPRAHLELLGYPNVTPLAVASGHVDAARSIDARPLASYFIQRGEPDDGLKDYFASFHIVISYLYDPDGFFQLNVMNCGKLQFLRGIHRPDDAGPLHATEALLKVLERIAIFDADPVPRLKFPSLAAPAVAGRWLAVHPGSGSERKNWPAGNWLCLLRELLHETDVRLLVIGGEADQPQLELLRRQLPGERVEYLQGVPLVEVGQRLARCAAFVGHDSGITHLAAAVGLPGLALWGGTNEAVWRPRSAGFELVRHAGGLTALPVAEVAERVADLLANLRANT